jgi:hypothetical protein
VKFNQVSIRLTATKLERMEAFVTLLLQLQDIAKLP